MSRWLRNHFANCPACQEAKSPSEYCIVGFQIYVHDQTKRAS